MTDRTSKIRHALCSCLWENVPLTIWIFAGFGNLLICLALCPVSPRPYLLTTKTVSGSEGGGSSLPRRMCPRRQRALPAVIRRWLRIIVLADLWGEAKAKFTQSSLVLKFFAARRREFLHQHEAQEPSRGRPAVAPRRLALHGSGRPVPALGGELLWACPDPSCGRL